jgi:hypothetical protein
VRQQPQIGLTVVDPSRMGGGSSLGRHSFAGGGAPGSTNILHRPEAPKTPRFIPPPPKREILGQIETNVSDADVTAIRAQLESAIEVLQLELEALKQEADLVRVETLRTSPGAYTTIPIIGTEFTPQEVRTQLIVVARQIETVAARILGGAPSAYLTEEQKQVVGVIVQDAKDLGDFIKQFDTEPIAAAHTRLSEQHLDSHVRGVKDVLATAEQRIVAVEGDGVPVREPIEKEAAVAGTILGVGVLVVLGLIAFEAL